ncbi:Gfo/Idh/MocA family oxidoreductase [Candidatus Aerophobetes bacterium]|nr:Gfo/Idh/MocA family oxidoreductase [Candidatus Aerophobetes bacterium]
MKIKWGVIGAGGFADKRSLPGMREARNCELTAVMVRNLDRAKKLAKKHGASKFYDKVEDLFKDEEIDAVYIATPVYLHKEHTIMAANYGKHVLCEKPMAMNTKECEEMIKACQDNKVKLMIGFMKRFHPFHQQIKRLIDEGKIGQIVEIRCQLHLWYPDTPGAWRQNPTLGGGGCLMDVGSHCIDLLCFLVGDVTEVMARAENVIFNYPVEDISTLILKFSTGAQGIVDTSFSIPYRENPVEIYGTRGTILAFRTMGPFNNPHAKMITENREEELKIPYTHDVYQAEFEHFAQCIQKNTPPLISGEDGLKNIQIIQAAYASAKEGKIVKISNN